MKMTTGQRWVLALTSLAGLMIVLDALVVTTAMHAIQLDLHASIGGTINAYNLSFAENICNGGHGRRCLSRAYNESTWVAAAVGIVGWQVAALLTERVAWAAARARDRAGAMRALDTVDDTYERRTTGVEEPEWVYWVHRSEIDVMAGRCFVELGEPSRARPLLQQAIDNYPKDRAREVALYQTWLAESYARNRDFDAAQETIGAVRKAADGIHSARLERRVVEIELMLSGRGSW